MKALSQEEKRRKLRELARDGGYASVVEMLKAFATDSISPAICSGRDCSYITDMEPDQDRGYCEACGGNTLVSALVLAGLGRPATGRDNLLEKGAFFASFVESILPLGWPAASALAEHLRIEEADSEPSVLDIGAGSGVYSIPFALRSPKVRITAVDLPEVLKVTQRIAERYGIGDRLKTVAGDMAEVNFGSGHHVATIGQILHGHDGVSNRKLLEKIYAALAPGGVVAIAEFLVKPDRSGPLICLIFGANMLVNTEAGNTYSFEEVHGWLKDAGFEQVRMFDVPGPPSLILATRPR